MKKILAVILCMLMILSLTACGSGTGSGDSGDSGDSGASAGAVSGGNGAEAEEEGSVQKPAEVLELEEKYPRLTEDELTWEYDTASKTIVVSGEGPMRDYSSVGPEWSKYCEEAVKVVIGDKVTSVGAKAFMWFSALSEVSLGSSVEFIDESAFDSCWELRTVNFPASLKYVGIYGFNNALLHSESGFALPEGLIYIGESSFWSAFKESTLTIPASLTTIGKNALGNGGLSAFNVSADNSAYASENGILYDKGMTTLINYPTYKADTLYEIPATVTTVLENAIQVTNTLEKIVIPASVTTIEEAAIYWNYGLKSIEVDANNTSYKSVDGVLFTMDGKTLLSYPIASDRTEYTVPEGTVRIGNYAMSRANNLTEIHTCEGLQEIGDLCMYMCSGVKTISLPKSLVSIEDRAIAYCDALTEVRYAGTSAEWEKVNIEEEDGYEFLAEGSAKVYCAE